MKLLRELINEDWGSSDWTAAVNHFVEDLGNYHKEDGIYDMMSAAYETALFYNDDRKFQNDPWSHFTPMSLIRMTVRRGRMPRDRMDDALDIANGEKTELSRTLAREME